MAALVGSPPETPAATPTQEEPPTSFGLNLFANDDIDMTQCDGDFNINCKVRYIFK